MSKTVDEIVDNSFKYIVSVRFEKVNKTYSFGTNDSSLQNGDKVVVETQRGLEFGTMISGLRDPIEHQINVPLKPVLRKATEKDIKDYERNIRDEEEALMICADEISKLGLDMHLISCEYTLDRAKITFVYIADERVDFRELLKSLAQIFHTRIDLRQIGARDKAKIVGGLGVCGRKLCCLHKSNFDVISINLAKNQLLALNISKLSGQCGKLKCCLKYENDIYTELREGLPKINAHVNYEGVNYRITSMNVLSDTCKLENKESAVYPKLSTVLDKGVFKVPLKRRPVSKDQAETAEPARQEKKSGSEKRKFNSDKSDKNKNRNRKNRQHPQNQNRNKTNENKKNNENKDNRKNNDNKKNKENRRNNENRNRNPKQQDKQNNNPNRNPKQQDKQNSNPNKKKKNKNRRHHNKNQNRNNQTGGQKVISSEKKVFKSKKDRNKDK